MKDSYQEFYNYIIKVLSISKIGLVFSKDPYALSNYEQIEKLSLEMLENFEHVKFDRHNYFQRNIYPTPNVSLRVAVFNKEKEILFVREVIDHGYSLPGGWCDLYDSPMDTARNECMQGAGIKIKNVSFCGIFNRTPFKQGIEKFERATVPEYLILLKAEIDGKFNEHEYETDDVKFFKKDQLPEKFSNKITKDEWLKIIDCAYNDKIIIE